MINQLKQQVNVPTGTIIMFPSATPPFGYLLCNGQTIKKNQFPELYGVVAGTVPDMTDRFVRAQNGNSSNIGQINSDTTAVNGLTGSAYHSHPISSYINGRSVNNINSLQISMAPGFSTKKGKRNVVSEATNATVSFSGDSETAPKNIIMAFYIKY